MPEMPYKVNLRMLQEDTDSYAKSLFGRLDKSLSPSVFFVAIFPHLIASNATPSPSEFNEWVQVIGQEDIQTIQAAFSSFTLEVQEVEQELANQSNVSSPLPVSWIDNPIYREEAIGLVLTYNLNQTNAATDRIYFCGRAVWRKSDRHFVCPVLSLDRKQYEKHPALKRPITLNEHSTSLLNLCIRQFLGASASSLKESHDEFERFRQLARNILVDSARAIMGFLNLTSSNKLNLKLNLFSHNLRLFDDCNSIAALPYEKREGYGELLIAERGHINIHVEIEFAHPVPISNHRLGRKVLEMTGNGLSVLCDRNYLYGLGNTKGQYDLTKEDLFKVEFLGLNSWRLLHDKDEMMSVVLGQPKLPAKPISPEEFRKEFNCQFNGTGNADEVFECLEAITKQSHGALLIVSDQALAETRRFVGQCIQVQPFPITADNIVQLAAIDGAILIDPQGQCHALGVILDGKAQTDEAPERGSRFNSAKRYISTRQEEGQKCLALVRSSDGMIDLI